MYIYKIKLVNITHTNAKPVSLAPSMLYPIAY